MKIKYFFTMIFIICITSFQSANAYLTYSATSICSVKQVTGYSSTKLTLSDAIVTAVNDCIKKGGIPSSCKARVKISDIRHVATSHCPITGVTGVGFAKTQAQAVRKAILQCIDKGGIRSYCHSGISY